MTNEPKAGKGLDPEMLAAYIDNRLPPEQRASVEAQLANDPDSYAVLVETMKALDDPSLSAEAHGAEVEAKVGGLSGAAAVLPMRPRGLKTRWVVAGSVLAVAAALAMVVWLQPEVWQRIRGGEPVDPLMAKLVEAVGEQRYIEARLTGGFKYGPLRSVTRGPGDRSQQNLALLAAAGELQQRANDAEPTSGVQHAWAIAQILVGNVDAAIESLELMSEAAPADGALLNDLGAAYLTRGSESRPDDLPKAVEVLERARAAAPTLAEADFNLALALERMNLSGQATKAWESFQKKEVRAEWLAIARSRSKALSPPGARMAPVGDLDGWLRLSGQTLSADLGRRPLSQLQPISELSELQRVQLERGEHSAERLLEWLRAVEQRPQHSAEVVMLLTLAAQAAHQNRYLDAARVAARAASLSGDEKIRLIGLHHIMRGLYMEGKADEVLAVANAALAHSDIGQLPFLRQRIYAHLGSISFVRGDYDQARRIHDGSRAQCAEMRDLGCEGAARLLLAETFRYLGEPAEAWRNYVWVIQHRVALPTDANYLTVHTSAALGAFAEGRPYLAKHLAEEAWVFAEQTGIAAYSTEAAYLIGRALAETGFGVESEQWLRTSQGRLSRVDDLGLRARLQAEVHTMSAYARLQSAPPMAVDSAHQALSAHQRAGGHHRDVRLLTLAGRAQSKVGSVQDAEASFDRAIELASAEKKKIGDAFLRQTFADDVWAPTAAKVQMLLERHQDQRALATLLGAASGDVEFRPQLASFSSSAGAALLVCFATDDAVHVWLLKGGSEPAYVRTPIRRQLLRGHATRLRKAVGEANSLQLAAVELDLIAESLVWPFQDQLSGVTQLFVIADPMLQRIPFALLPLSSADPSPLVAGRSVALCDQPATCGAVTPPRQLRKATALFAEGDPTGGTRLASVEAEARQVSSVYSSNGVVASTVDSWRMALEQSDVVHYAGHAYLNPERPWLSGVVVEDRSQSRRVAIKDLISPTVRARVVVLSGCSTVGGDELNGQGVVGLGSEFLRRGAREIVGTLWPVDDQEMRAFIPSVHEKLASGLRAAEAVRSAQLDAMRQGLPVRTWGAVVSVTVN